MLYYDHAEADGPSNVLRCQGVEQLVGCMQHEVVFRQTRNKREKQLVPPSNYRVKRSPVTFFER